MGWEQIDKIVGGQFIKVKNGFQYSLILTKLDNPAFTSSIRYPDSYQHVLKVQLLDLIETNVNYIEILKSEHPKDYAYIIGMEINEIFNLGLSNTGVVQFLQFLRDNDLVIDHDDKTTSLKPEALKFKWTYERKGSGFGTENIFNKLEKPKTGKK